MRLLVTGAAGFIGSNFVRYMLEKYPAYEIVVLDKLTYAGNLDNLGDLAGHPHYEFVQGDIANSALVRKIAQGCTGIVNFAAETHVDRSIQQAGDFIMTDVFGTYVLLEAARDLKMSRFVQISTDEVYGHIEGASSVETDPLRPRSPYAASKAGGDHMVYAFHITYGVPAMITRGSNNYGPYQYPEKLIPLFITNAIEDKPLPIYGDGQQIRDWLHVLDHCTGIDTVLHKGVPGEMYNVGGGNERTNLWITHEILRLVGKPESLIKYVDDRPGHDRRYSLDTGKLRGLGWAPTKEFDQGLRETVEWYLQNRWWWEKLKSGEYARYYDENYGKRLAGTPTPGNKSARS